MVFFFNNFHFRIFYFFYFFYFFIRYTCEQLFYHCYLTAVYSFFKKNTLRTVYNGILASNIIISNYSYYYPIFDKTSFWLRYTSKEATPFFFVENYGNVSSIKYDLTRFPVSELNLKNSWVYSIYELLSSIKLQPVVDKINFFSKFLYFNPNTFVKNKLGIFSLKKIFNQAFYFIWTNYLILKFASYFNFFFLILVKFDIYVNSNDCYVTVFLILAVIDYIFMRFFLLIFFFLLSCFTWVSYKIMFLSISFFDINYNKIYWIIYTVSLNFKFLFFYLADYFSFLFVKLQNFLQILIELLFPKVLLYSRSSFFHLWLRRKIDEFVETWFSWKH